jgi:hypothetical protein
LPWYNAWGYEPNVLRGGLCSDIGLRKEQIGTQLRLQSARRIIYVRGPVGLRSDIFAGCRTARSNAAVRALR